MIINLNSCTKICLSDEFYHVHLSLLCEKIFLIKVKLYDYRGNWLTWLFLRMVDVSIYSKRRIIYGFRFRENKISGYILLFQITLLIISSTYFIYYDHDTTKYEF